MKNPEQEAEFLNVDLDIEAAYDLSPLVNELGERVLDLHTGPLGAGFQTHLELAGEDEIQPVDAETAIQNFLRLLSSLTPPIKRLWDDASKRDFNIGFQAGTTPHAFEFALSPGTLAAVGALGARVVMTVYAVDHTRRKRATRRKFVVDPDV